MHAEAAVLADEAHRTQYGALGAAINSALPNAPRIAFTGTPLIKGQKTVGQTEALEKKGNGASEKQ